MEHKPIWGEKGNYYQIFKFFWKNYQQVYFIKKLMSFVEKCWFSYLNMSVSLTTVVFIKIKGNIFQTFRSYKYFYNNTIYKTFFYYIYMKESFIYIFKNMLTLEALCL